MVETGTEPGAVATLQRVGNRALSESRVAGESTRLLVPSSTSVSQGSVGYPRTLNHCKYTWTHTYTHTRRVSTGTAISSKDAHAWSEHVNFRDKTYLYNST
jgi:hypothetical protein